MPSTSTDKWGFVFKKAMINAVIYIHGKGGSAQEAVHYQRLFQHSAVIGFDYKAQTPWEAEKEFPEFFDSISHNHQSVTLVASSLGAYFTMNALSNKRIEKAFFISPVANMEKLISGIMLWANVSEEELYTKKETKTAFGETLSWEYLLYMREHPVCWQIPTHILYGENIIWSHLIPYLFLDSWILHYQ